MKRHMLLLSLFFLSVMPQAGSAQSLFDLSAAYQDEIIAFKQEPQLGLLFRGLKISIPESMPIQLPLPPAIANPLNELAEKIRPARERVQECLAGNCSLNLPPLTPTVVDAVKTATETIAVWNNYSQTFPQNLNEFRQKIDTLESIFEDPAGFVEATIEDAVKKQVLIYLEPLLDQQNFYETVSTFQQMKDEIEDGTSIVAWSKSYGWGQIAQVIACSPGCIPTELLQLFTQVANDLRRQVENLSDGEILNLIHGALRKPQELQGFKIKAGFTSYAVIAKIKLGSEQASFTTNEYYRFYVKITPPDFDLPDIDILDDNTDLRAINSLYKEYLGKDMPYYDDVPRHLADINFAELRFTNLTTNLSRLYSNPAGYTGRNRVIQQINNRLSQYTEKLSTVIMNKIGEVVDSSIHTDQIKTFLREGKEPSEIIVNEIFLQTLSALPSASQRAWALQELDRGTSFLELKDKMVGKYIAPIVVIITNFLL